MTYLVTGAAGFIGYHVCTRLRARGDTVVGLDSINDYYDPGLKTDRLRELGVENSTLGLGDSTQSVLNERFVFIRAKIEEREFLDSVFASHQFDCVLHLAAQAGVRHSIDNPHAYLDSNLQGFLNILESCQRAKIAHLVFASSSSVYGLNANRPYRVTDHSPKRDEAWDGLVPNPSRSSVPYRIYNIGNNKPERLGNFIDILERSLGKKAQRLNFPMQAGDVYATEADITELSDDFGWNPTTGIEDGLARFAEWYLEYKKKRGNR